MNSKKKPLWLVFENEDELGEDVHVMFKNGDGEDFCISFYFSTRQVQYQDFVYVLFLTFLKGLLLYLWCYDKRFQMQNSICKFDIIQISTPTKERVTEL